MTSVARRAIPIAVLLAGLLAAAVVIVVAGRWRVADRTRADRDVARLVATSLDARVDARFRAIRSAALAFDLASLSPTEMSGVLRLAYTQNDDVTAVTLVDEQGHAVVPAVYIARGGARASESIDDLNLFSRHIPFATARARGRGVDGPYDSLRGGPRVAFAESIPVADGTRAWVIAAELDVARLLEGIARGVSDADVMLVTDALALGDNSPSAVEIRDEVRAMMRSRGRRMGPDPVELSGSDWRAIATSAPSGLGGAIVIAWRAEDLSRRRARSNDLALGMVILTILGALAAAVSVVLREPPTPAAKDGPRSLLVESRVLGAVVKELANPISATAAAAQLLSSEFGGKSRVVETMQRAATRTQRAFRRVSRLARGAEEINSERVDLAAAAKREVEMLRIEAEQSGHRLEYQGPAEGAMVHADADDIGLLVQSLVDAARSLAPADTLVGVQVSIRENDEAMLVVSDRGTVPAAEREDATALERVARKAAASPALALALAVRICEDHRARLELVDREGSDAGVDAVVHFGEPRNSLHG